MVDGTEKNGEYWPQICDTSVVQFPTNSQAGPELNRPSETVVNNMAKRAIPPSDILINFSRPCDDAAKAVDSLLRCRRLNGRRPDCSGIALYLYVSRDTAPLIEAKILEGDMAVEFCAAVQR